jgi:uncharacterized membrane protein YidH (DUF202 family)
MARRPDIEEQSPGLARERTELAWSRTAIGFAALGGAILKTNVPGGLTVAAMGLLIWGLHHIFPDVPTAGARPRRLLLVTVAVTAVALVALVVALLSA